MKSGNTISIGKILWNLLRKPIIKGMTIERASELAVECMRLVGAPATYEQKVTNPPLQLSSYKALLPPNIIAIQGVRYRECKDCDWESALALRGATDQYQVAKDCNDCNEIRGAEELTYIVQNNVIVTSLETGYVQVSYTGITVDSQGFPMIPDEQVLIKAIEYYIIWSYLEDIWHTGEIPDKAFNYYEQKKLFYMPSAENALKMPNVDQMESMTNALNRILIRTNWHDNFFKHFGNKERLKRYN